MLYVVNENVQVKLFYKTAPPAEMLGLIQSLAQANNIFLGISMILQGTRLTALPGTWNFRERKFLT